MSPFRRSGAGPATLLGGFLAVVMPVLAEADGPGPGSGGVQMTKYGTTPDGTPIEQYVLTDGTMTAKVITYGGIVTELIVPDRDGKPGDVVLGFDSLEGYLGKHPYFGALVGRYANRIAGGKFELGGKTYQLAKNDGPNALHGGLKGFDKVVWKARALGENSLQLSYTSPAGEEGYPGTLRAAVTYTVKREGAASMLRIDYEATTDAPTPINLTNHSYFNLTAKKSSDVRGHVFEIESDQYTPVDETLIPTGELATVKGTPFDFTKPTPLAENLRHLTKGEEDKGGIDHNFVLRGGMTEEPREVVRVVEPESGRVMAMRTTEPGVQFYTGNFLDGTNEGKGGWTYRKHHGFCLEAQHYPDSPNQPKFPSAILEPGQTYRQTTEYVFTTTPQGAK